MKRNSLMANHRQRLQALAFSILLVVTGSPRAAAAAGINLVIDGERITASPVPFVVNGRTLAPLRLIAEKLGAMVDWNGDTQTITVNRGDRQVRMRLDNRLVDLGLGEVAISDVPPHAYNSRTFIPLRLFATALGVSVTWDQATGTVRVDSRIPVGDAPDKLVAITSVQPGQTISEPTPLQLTWLGPNPAGAAEVRYQLLDPATGRGPVVARGSDPTATCTLLPDPFYSGPRVLAVGVYDQNGGFLAGDAVPVVMAPSATVTMAGLLPGQKVTGTVSLTPSVNFQATFVRYELTDPATASTTQLGQGDPADRFTWTPQWADNGNRTIRVAAYDRLGQAHYSQPLPITVEVPRRLALTGVKADAVVDGPVTLGVSANFVFSKVQYVLRDPVAGTSETLYEHDGPTAYRWLPVPAQAGRREVLATVTDAQNNVFSTDPVPVQVKGDPKISLLTVGPNQVLNGTVPLRVEANVPLSQVEFQLMDPQTGMARTIAAGADAQATYTWTAGKTDNGFWRIRAVGLTADGSALSSAAIPVRVYAGTLYGPRPIMDKSKFQDFASGLAVRTMQKTGMSAALQVAQAILETGWGQSSPVDKYTGKVSNNLFGIKGNGPAGSVISNTWEVYNGVSYRIDDTFRAYASPAQSWDDHQQLLLTRSWYEPFRKVMHDSTQGAWALKRCGYATDPQYPTKLIEIIQRYGLYRLDEIGI